MATPHTDGAKRGSDQTRRWYYSRRWSAFLPALPRRALHRPTGRRSSIPRSMAACWWRFARAARLGQRRHDPAFRGRRALGRMPSHRDPRISRASPPMIAASVLIAVERQGTILRSTDAGKTWQAAHNTTMDTDLRAVVNQPGSRNLGCGGHERPHLALDRRRQDLEPGRIAAQGHVPGLVRRSGTQAMLIGGDEGMVGFSKDAGESAGRSPRSRCRTRPRRSPRFIASANYCSPPARSADS